MLSRNATLWDPEDFVAQRKDFSVMDMHPSDAPRTWGSSHSAPTQVAAQDSVSERRQRARATCIACSRNHREPQPEREVPLSAAISDDTLSLLGLQRSEVPATVSPASISAMIFVTSQQRTPLAGCAFSNKEYWRRLCPDSTGNRWAQQGGLDWPTVDSGPQRRSQTPKAEKRPEMREKVRAQVRDLERLGVIEDVPVWDRRATAELGSKTVHQYISAVFAIPKPNKPEEHRFLHDLRASGANAAMVSQKHRQDGPAQVKRMVTTETFACPIDIIKCFYQFSVLPQLRRMLRFWAPGATAASPDRLVQMTAISMGATPAPYCITKAMRAPLQQLSKAGVRAPIKIDDALPMGEGYANALVKTWLTVKVTSKLGVRWCPVKSETNPTQAPVWHGKQWCFRCLCLFVPDSKIPGIQQRYRDLKAALLRQAAPGEARSATCGAAQLASLSSLDTSRASGGGSRNTRGTGRACTGHGSHTTRPTPRAMPAGSSAPLTNMSTTATSTATGVGTPTAPTTEAATAATSTVTGRMFEQAIGRGQAHIDAVDEARGMNANIQELKNWILKHHGRDRPVPADSLPREMVAAAVADCDQWLRPAELWNGKSFDPATLEWPVATIEVDASDYQLGVAVPADSDHPEISMSRPLTKEEGTFHITQTELRAAVEGAMLTIEQRQYSNCTLGILVDATTSKKYIREFGGPKLWYCLEVQKLNRLCRARGVRLWCGHIPGKLNDRADYNSRHFLGIAEYAISKTAMDVLQAEFNCSEQFEVDLFAGRWNTQARVYCTLDASDRVAHTVDAFATNWAQFGTTLYAFPPPNLAAVTRAVHQVQAQQVGAVVLFCPLWASLPWALIVPMMAAWPVEFQATQSLLSPPPSYRQADGWTELKWWTEAQYDSWIGLCLSGKRDSPAVAWMVSQRMKIREAGSKRQRQARLVDTWTATGSGSGRRSRPRLDRHPWLSATLMSAEL